MVVSTHGIFSLAVDKYINRIDNLMNDITPRIFINSANGLTRPVLFILSKEQHRSAVKYDVKRREEAKRAVAVDIYRTLAK